MRAVNLIPVDQRGGTSLGAGRSGGGAYAVLALLAGLALLALLYGSAHRKASSARAKAVVAEAQAQQAQAAVAKLSPYTSFIALREQRVQAVSALAGSRFDWPHAFHELGRVLPSSVSLASVTGAVGSPGAPGSGGAASTPSGASAAGGAVASATPPGSVPTITLTGCATSQSAVAHMLDRLRLIDGVASVTLQSSTKAGAGANSCSPADPVFSVSLTFHPLPAVAAASAPLSPSGSTTKTVSTGGTR